MYVDSINFLDCRYDGKSARHIAMIHVLLGSNNITLRCTSGQVEKAPVQSVISGLLADAKRQLLRMPEYRSGSQTLHFDHASDAELNRVAA
ncbi:MAG: hypothetical protein Q9M48_15185 [Rhodobacterales bacterium]|nr:hypothetical protein [Rhodobacterales bacterium]